MYQPQFASCIDACNACAQFCEACAGDDSGALLPDCAQICRVAASFMARHSDFSDELCILCKEICDACAAAYATHAEERLRRCAEQCHLCGAECRKMLASLRHGRERKPTGGPYAG